MLNGCRVDVRQSELAPIAIDDEASKKSVSMVYYENHNYTYRLKSQLAQNTQSTPASNVEWG